MSSEVMRLQSSLLKWYGQEWNVVCIDCYCALCDVVCLCVTFVDCGVKMILMFVLRRKFRARQSELSELYFRCYPDLNLN